MVADFTFDKFLCLNGDSVEVITTSKSVRSWQEIAIEQGVKIRTFSCVGPNIYGFSIAAFLYVLFILVFKRHKFDVVFFGGIWNFLTIFAPLICMATRTRYIVVPHGMLVKKLIEMKSKKLKTWVLRLFLERVLAQAHRVYFTTREEMKEAGFLIAREMRVCIMPLVLDLQPFSYAALKRKNVAQLNPVVRFVFIGRVTPKKRLDIIFDAFLGMPAASAANMEFFVVGPDYEGLLRNLRYKELAHKISYRYLGLKNSTELIDMYVRADVFILPSESENFGIGAAEAGAAGCALLLSNNVGITEYLPEQAYATTQLCHNDLKREMLKFVNDPEYLTSLKRASQKACLDLDMHRADYGKFIEAFGICGD